MTAHISEEWFVSDGDIVRKVSAGETSGVTRLKRKRKTKAPTSEQLRSEWDRSVLRGARPIYEIDEMAAPVLRIADLFSGCGGLTLGVMEATRALGCSPEAVAAFDENPQVLEVYERNLRPQAPAAINLWDAVEFQVTGRGDTARFIGNPSIAARELSPLAGRVDVLTGGPPCQGHSTFNNRTRQDDPRNVLYLMMPAAAVALGARSVIVENVPNVLNDRTGVVQTAKCLFRSAGYEVVDKVVSGLSLGIPQTRRRHLLIATRGSVANLEGALRATTTEPRDVRWAIEDLENRDGASPFDRPAGLSALNLNRIRHLFEEGQYDMPNHMRPDSHKKGHTYPAVYGRLSWQDPSGTITTGFNTPGRGRFIHPSLPRTLTAHEAARLQGFPDWFDFRLADGSVPSRTWLARMIGDAVPPKLGYVAAVAAIGAILLPA